MKLIVKDNETNINISIPMWIITSGLKILPFTGKYYIKKKYNKKSDVTLNESGNEIDILSKLDYKLLRTITKELKKYKGLKLIEIESSDGDHVSIEI